MASDRLAHGTHRGVVSAARRKVSRVNQRLLIGTAGLAACVDETGTIKLDLHASLVAEAARLSWGEPREAARALGSHLRTQLLALERIALPGAPDRSLAPTITIFVAGRSPQGSVFAMRLTAPITLSPGLVTHHARFGSIRIDDVRVHAGATTAEGVSRLPDVVDGAVERVVRPGLDTPALFRLIQPHIPLNVGALEAAAREVVHYTMRRDPEIGGAVQVEGI